MASPRERPKCQVTTHFFPSLPVTNRHSRAPDFLSFNIALFTGPLFHSSSRSPQNPSPPNTNNSYKVIFNLVYLQVYEFSTATNSLIILLFHPLIGVSAFTHTFHPTVCVPSPLDPLHWARNPRQPNASQAQGRISHFEFRNIGLFLIYGYRPNGQPINSLRNNLIPGQMSPLISYASLSRNPHPRAARERKEKAKRVTSSLSSCSRLFMRTREAHSCTSGVKSKAANSPRGLILYARVKIFTVP
jgi:hypothetical protein